MEKWWLVLTSLPPLLRSDIRINTYIIYYKIFWRNNSNETTWKHKSKSWLLNLSGSMNVKCAQWHPELWARRQLRGRCRCSSTHRLWESSSKCDTLWRAIQLRLKFSLDVVLERCCVALRDWGRSIQMRLIKFVLVLESGADRWPSRIWSSGYFFLGNLLNISLSWIDERW